ncbi:GtrA family protein [Microvirga vignae]
MASQHNERDAARVSPSSRSAGNTAGMFVRYVLFAILATLANLLTQEVTVRLAPVAPLALSILMGTVAGFVLKYLLDKKWVFDDGYDGHKQELQKITLYGAFSVLTTLVFWGFEIAFWAIWRTDFAKYSGAVLGLAVGYAAKFMLDRSFVFKERQA